MRKTYHRKNIKKSGTKELRVNEKIFAQQLEVIDENGVSLGVIEKIVALEEAKNRGYDLVEVSPKTLPPIAKFMNYGSYKYQKDKMERKARAKQKTAELKTVKVSSRIGQHDMDIRASQAAKFIQQGNKVKIELQLKGREHQHKNLAEEIIGKIISSIAENFPGKQLKIEQGIKQLGSKISTIVSL
jgi:translation initiation factor IF-3